MEKMSKGLLYYFGGIDILLKINRQIASAAGTRGKSALLKKDPNILAVIKTSSYRYCQITAD